MNRTVFCARCVSEGPAPHVLGPQENFRTTGMIFMGKSATAPQPEAGLFLRHLIVSKTLAILSELRQPALGSSELFVNFTLFLDVQ